jgi:hypothetical protein
MGHTYAAYKARLSPAKSGYGYENWDAVAMSSTASAPVRPAVLTERHPHTLPPPPPTSRSVELAPVRVEVPLSSRRFPTT